jgi:hypothetical protein
MLWLNYRTIFGGVGTE